MSIFSAGQLCALIPTTATLATCTRMVHTMDWSGWFNPTGFPRRTSTFRMELFSTNPESWFNQFIQSSHRTFIRSRSRDKVHLVSMSSTCTPTSHPTIWFYWLTSLTLFAIFCLILKHRRSVRRIKLKRAAKELLDTFWNYFLCLVDMAPDKRTRHVAIRCTLADNCLCHLLRYPLCVHDHNVCWFERTRSNEVDQRFVRFARWQNFWELSSDTLQTVEPDSCPVEFVGRVQGKSPAESGHRTGFLADHGNCGHWYVVLTGPCQGCGQPHAGHRGGQFHLWHSPGRNHVAHDSRRNHGIHQILSTCVQLPDCDPFCRTPLIRTWSKCTKGGQRTRSS